MDKVQEAKDEFVEAMFKKPEHVQKRHFSDIISNIKEIAEEYMDDVSVVSSCSINSAG